MKVIASFFTDKFSVLQEFWERAAKNNAGSAFKGTDNVEKLNLGGLITLLDWDKQKILKRIKIGTPRGFDYNSKNVYFAKGNQEVVIFSKNLDEEKRRFSHPHFNNLHSVNLSDRGLLFSCSGLDLILETDFRGNTLYEWFATENGFSKDPKGRIKKVDPSKDYRTIKFATLRQTTHLNSAVYAGKTKYFSKTIYCSLFHQGQILAIDRKTGRKIKVMDHLKHPHSINKQDNGFLISDTENKRIILVDKDFKKQNAIKIDSDWIQDASMLPNGNILVSDANNFRLAEVDIVKRRICNEFSYPTEWKIFNAKALV